MNEEDAQEDPGIEIELNEEDPQEDPVAKIPEQEQITNSCKFQCKYCNQETPSWGQMAKHLKLEHQVKKRHDPFELVIGPPPVYDCPKCKKPILKDRSLIYNHMFSSHKITIQRGERPSNPDLVKNECTFKCKYCPQMSNSWKRARNHHYKNHKSEGSMPSPSECVIGSKFHECTLCGKKILKDNRIIYIHKNSAHSQRKGNRSTISVQKQKQIISKRPKIVSNDCKFKCNYCGQVFSSWWAIRNHHYINHKSVGNMPTANDCVIEKKLHKCSKCEKELLKDNSIVLRHMKHGHTNKVRKGKDHLVKNECTFKCKYCSQMSNSWDGARTHYYKNHKSEGSMPSPSDLVIECKFHPCPLCGDELLKDNRIIYNHMVSKHNKSKKKKKAKTKRNEHLVENECKFRCPHCEEVFNNWSATLDHHRNNHISLGSILSYKDMVIESKFHPCPLCGEEVLKDNRIIYSHMASRHNKSKKKAKTKRSEHLVANECKFGCPHCQEVFNSWNATYMHHLSNHKTLGSILSPGELVIESKFHSCHLCQEEVLKDNRVIYDHMRNKHNKGKDNECNLIPKNVDIVENGCNFKCKYCTKNFESWESIMLHHKSSHESVGSAYLPYDSVIDSKFHECLLCKKEVLKDNMLIYTHIYNVHNVTTNSYKKWLKLQTDKTSQRTSHSRTDTPASENRVQYRYDQKSTHGTNNADIFEITNDENIDKESPDYEQMINACVFKCKYCEKECPSWSKLTRHNLESHQVKGREDPFELIIHYKIYQCHMCNKPMLQDRKFIYNHMLHSHKITIPKMQIGKMGKPKKEHLVQNECKFKCNYCTEVLNCWEAVRIHHRANHKTLGAMALPMDSVIEKKFHVCKLCGKEVLKDNRLIYFHNVSAHKANNCGTKKQHKPADSSVGGVVENQCKFKCKHCPEVYNSWDETLGHLKTDHESTDITAVPHDLVVESTIHTCCLCKQELLEDNRLINDHIKDAHNLTANAYKRWLTVKAQVQNGKRDVRKESVTHDEETQSEISQDSGIGQSTSMSQDGSYISDQDDVGAPADDESDDTNSNFNPTEYLRMDTEEGNEELAELPNKCKFQCQPCGSTFGTWNLTRNHIRETHKDQQVRI